MRGEGQTPTVCGFEMLGEKKKKKKALKIASRDNPFCSVSAGLFCPFPQLALNLGKLVIWELIGGKKKKIELRL